jgi:hypothetical protein
MEKPKKTLEKQKQYLETRGGPMEKTKKNFRKTKTTLEKPEKNLRLLAYPPPSPGLLENVFFLMFFVFANVFCISNVFLIFPMFFVFIIFLIFAMFFFGFLYGALYKESPNIIFCVSNVFWSFCLRRSVGGGAVRERRASNMPCAANVEGFVQNRYLKSCKFR